MRPTASTAIQQGERPVIPECLREEYSVTLGDIAAKMDRRWSSRWIKELIERIARAEAENATLKAQLKEGVCEWCDRPIFYDRGAKMYFFRREDCSRSYYCPRDKNEDRCQHIPKETPK